MLARCLPGVVLVLAVLSAANARAEPTDTRAPLTLEWSAPPDCSSSGHILEEVATILGHSPALSKAVAVRAVAEADPRGHWGVSLVVEGQGESGKRRFEAESCEAAAEATALIVALTIEPTHLIGAPPPPVAPSPLAPPLVDAPETPASRGDASGPPIAAGATLSPSTAAVRGVSAAPKARARATPPSGLLGARISLGGDVGTFPSANLGGELAVTTTLRHLRFEVAGTYWAPATATPSGQPQEGATLELATLGIRGAYLFTLDKVGLGPFVGVEGDRVLAAGFGGVQHSDRTAVWGAVDFGAAASWWASSGHSLGVEERVPAFDERAGKVLTSTPRPPLAKPTFEEIYRAHFGFVWRGVRALGVASEAIDDVVQEIFLIAHRRLPEFEGRSSIRTWLSGVMLNAARHHRRTASRKRPYEQSREAPMDVDALPTAADGPHDLTVAHERARLLERILDDLGEKKREILVLAELEELTAAEIAEILGLSANTVSSRLRLARQDFERLAARHRARERGRVQ